MKKFITQCAFWCIFYILGYHRLFGVSAKSQASEDKSYVMQIGSKFMHGLQFDQSLCRIFQPTLQRSSVSFDRFGPLSGTNVDRENKRYYITKMKPMITKNPHYKRGRSPVRFILLNRCNPVDRRAANLLEGWSKQSGSVECQSRDFFKVLSNCHDEQMFIWSSKAKTIGGNIETTGEEFPEGYGIEFREEYYMMMVIYEYIDTEIIDNSGLELFYKETERHRDNAFRPIKRLLVGQQAIHKHVMLSGLDGWLTMGVCSGLCTSRNGQTREVISVDVHTRYLGTGVRVDVGYKDLRRTSNFGEPREYMLDTPLVPDVPLSHRHEVRNGVQRGDQNSTIQTVRRRFWDPEGGKRFYKLLPGDDVIVKCAYSTIEEIQPVLGGMNSNEEICFAFISYVNKNERRGGDAKVAGEVDKNIRLEHDFEFNYDGDLTTCMSSPAYQTITAALKLDQFGQEDGEVVLSGTRRKRKNKHPKLEQTTKKLDDYNKPLDQYHFLTDTHKNQHKSKYVRFEDPSDDPIKKVEPREAKAGKILNDDADNKGTILGGVADAIINATKDIILNQNPSSSFVFLSNFLSNTSTFPLISNNRITSGQKQTNVEAFIDAIDEYDHRSGYTQKRQANGAIMRGIHETACIRSHPEIFGFRKVGIIKKFYIYGDKDQKFKRKPRRLNQNIPLLMDNSGFKAQNNVALPPSISIYIIICYIFIGFIVSF